MLIISWDMQDTYPVNHKFILLINFFFYVFNLLILQNKKFWVKNYKFVDKKEELRKYILQY